MRHREPKRPPLSRGSGRPGQRGAALLLAMIILALVTTLAAGMVWQQARAVQVEAAERARAQAAWVLTGALDWARLILREDLRAAQRRGPLYTSLGDSWATPLEEARLSSFLAADQDNNVDSGPEAFISGAIVDAQSRYNLRNLVDGTGRIVPAQLAGLQRLAQAAGAPGSAADEIAQALARAFAPAGARADPQAPLKPERVADLRWLGVDGATLAQLRPFVTLLPAVTPVNANTAPAEVLLAAVDGLDLGSAQRLVQARRRNPYTTPAAVQALLPQGATLDPTRLGVFSAWFEVSGRLRLDGRVLEQRSLLQRDLGRVTVRRTERRSFATPAR
ncbi:MAG: type II secretion system minor pseudopilin GspK [Burkholderiales bacterium]|nr:type II secretion system minor pseudopilin GspK [Burkholderiales bacterium]